MDLQGKEHLPEQADHPVVEGMDEDVLKVIRKYYR
jgi:septum formation topological specificity factor MinE